MTQDLVFVHIMFHNFFILKTAKLAYKRQLPGCSTCYYERFLHVYVFLCSLIFNRNMFYENSNVFNLEHRTYFHKTVSVKVNVRLHWTFYITLLNSVFICKQRLWNAKEIIQYLQCSKCYKAGEDRIRIIIKICQVFGK